MAERVLPENLSGEEIRVAVIDKLMTRLAKDGHLNVAHAYDHFSYKISVHIELHDLGRIETVNVTESATPIATDDENVALDAFDAELEGAQTDPNTMREETGQEIPVLTKSAEGKPEVKGIRYPRKKK
jgi:hypothetical protein